MFKRDWYTYEITTMDDIVHRFDELIYDLDYFRGSIAKYGFTFRNNDLTEQTWVPAHMIKKVKFTKA